MLEEIIALVNNHNTFGPSVLGCTQFLSEISTRKLPAGKAEPECRFKDSTAICNSII
jgi:hypothetical protein